MDEARYDHACGVVGHKEVLAAGGTNTFEIILDTVEILSLATLEWRTGIKTLTEWRDFQVLNLPVTLKLPM